MKTNVAVVGFYGTGSSALIDFLREFDRCGVALDRDAKGALRPYEHVPFYTSGGLFEFGELMTNVNSAYGSDMIINKFIDSVDRLNDNNFVSFGSYRWLTGNRFKEISEEFLEQLGVYEANGATSEHKVKTRFSLVMVLLQFAAKIVFGRPVYRWGKKNIYDNKPTMFGMPDKETFYRAAKQYVKKYFDICAQENKDVMVYDQLVCPQHTTLLDNYFDDSFKVITVHRDCRDIYSLSKYFWSKPPYGFSAPLPTDIDRFADYWEKNTTYKEHKNLKRVQFEDLIYHYDETTAEIMEFLGLDEKDHIRKKQYFNPEFSIKNTQSFLMNEETKLEAEEIAKKLPKSVYDFPYEIKTSYSEMFDDSKEVNKKDVYDE